MILPNNYYEVLDKGYVGLVNTMGSDLDIASKLVQEALPYAHSLLENNND